ncbi:hypothetical protein C7476_111136 [Phyllobacterium bourgognense]|uniref:Uncharacterized protein n=1 Tax=Phyllobacterium bourgognense TaxID=314236 RepID=A0A368YSY1_9HYPH|nr:hypothetical protein C7476_111136 [Phyllobacterium bourgognense]
MRPNPVIGVCANGIESGHSLLTRTTARMDSFPTFLPKTLPKNGGNKGLAVIGKLQSPAVQASVSEQSQVRVKLSD